MAIEIYTVPSDHVIHETKVDFTQRYVQKAIHVVQYDKSLPIIAVHLYKDGFTYTLPQHADVKIRWGKRDHTFVYKNVLGCDSTRQIVYFDIDEQMTYFSGPCNPILELIVSGNKAGSSSMPFEVDRNPIQNGDIESKVEYPEIEEVVEKVAELDEECFKKENMVTEMLSTNDPRGDEVIPTNRAIKLKLNECVKYENRPGTPQGIAAKNGDETQVLYHHFTHTGFQVNKGENENGETLPNTEQRNDGFFATEVSGWGAKYGAKFIDRVTPTKTYKLEIPQEDGTIATQDYVQDNKTAIKDGDDVVEEIAVKNNFEQDEHIVKTNSEGAIQAYIGRFTSGVSAGNVYARGTGTHNIGASNNRFTNGYINKIIFADGTEMTTAPSSVDSTVIKDFDGNLIDEIIAKGGYDTDKHLILTNDYGVLSVNSLSTYGASFSAATPFNGNNSGSIGTSANRFASGYFNNAYAAGLFPISGYTSVTFGNSSGTANAFRPYRNGVHDLGTSSYRWNNTYTNKVTFADGTSITSASGGGGTSLYKHRLKDMSDEYYWFISTSSTPIAWDDVYQGYKVNNIDTQPILCGYKTDESLGNVFPIIPITVGMNDHSTTMFIFKQVRNINDNSIIDMDVELTDYVVEL